jgi:hypothetical protein
MSPRNRVLGPNGFEPFPERHIEKAVEQGTIPAPQDEGDPNASNIGDHGVQGKKELSREAALKAAAQKYHEKLPKRNLSLELKDSQEKGSEPVDPTAHNLPDHGVNGKKEIAKKQAKDRLAQEALEKKIEEAKLQASKNK